MSISQKKHFYFFLFLVLLYFFIPHIFYSCQKKQLLAHKLKLPVCNYNGNINFPEKMLSRYEAEIKKFRKADKIKMPPENCVVFTGSSSIRSWLGLQNDFSDITVINRGFGGSTFAELIYYSYDVIFKYKPKKVLVYEGDNDQYFQSVKQITENICLFGKIFRDSLPDAELYFISVKPSPARRDKLHEMALTNMYLIKYAYTHEKTYFIDVSRAMFDGNHINGKIFSHDSLHMNKNGYIIWKEIIKQYWN